MCVSSTKETETGIGEQQREDGSGAAFHRSAL